MNIEELVSRNYNLDIKNPNTAEEDFGDSETLLKEYEIMKNGLSTSISKLQAELESLFGK